MINIRPQKYSPYIQRVNGTIASAISMYENRGVPLRQLITDFNLVLSHSEDLIKAFNAWEHLNNNINKIPVVCGVSIAETLFNFAAMSLKKQKPIQVIKSVFYRNKERNDSGLEMIFVDSILSMVSPSQKMLIVNPSPIMIEFFEKNNRNITYAVIDNVLAELYKKQYPDTEFISFENINHVSNVEILILITSNIKESDIPFVMRCMEIASAEYVFGILQTRLINNKQSNFWNEITKGNWKIDDIVLLPKQLSNSSPRTKCFISMNKEYQTDLIRIRKLEFDESSKLVKEMEEALTVTLEELYTYNTVKLLWKKKHENVKDETCEREYLAAKQYMFSKEIYISYSIYSYSNGFYAKAYYAATDNTLMPMIRGKALTTRTTKGLRGKTVEDVIDALEGFTYNPKVSEEIINDIKTHYLSGGKQVSLKTLWFCLRTSLEKKHNYDELIAQRIFSKDNKSISGIYPEEVSGELIREELCTLFEEGEEGKELQYLKIMNAIIEEAISEGLLSVNKISPLIPMAKYRASKRQSEVRQALTKKSFEKIEEKRIMNFLLPICIKSSAWLAVMIRLLTGISIKEVCGLQWKDFTYNADMDIYQLSVTKLIDNNGKMISHAMEEHWEKYRVLPIDSLLGRLLVLRKDHLFEKGLEEISEYPIVMEREDFSQMQKGGKEEYCRPAVIAKKCREAVSKAGIAQHLIILPENGSEVEIDINSYNGDIFKTNFRNKALNEAGFGLDEIHYYLGMKGPDTFSRHYCDYSNEHIQLIIARKLERLVSSYMSVKTKGNCEKTFCNDIYEGFNGGVSCAEFVIDKANKYISTTIRLNVESKYGFKITTSSYKKR